MPDRRLAARVAYVCFPGSLAVGLRWVPLEEAPGLRLSCVYDNRLIPAVAGTDAADSHQQFSGELAWWPQNDA